MVFQRGHGAPTRPGCLPEPVDTTIAVGGDDHNFDPDGNLIGSRYSDPYPGRNLVFCLHPCLFIVFDCVADGRRVEPAVIVSEFGEVLPQTVGTHHEIRVVVVLNECSILGNNHLIEHLTKPYS